MIHIRKTRLAIPLAVLAIAAVSALPSAAQDDYSRYVQEGGLNIPMYRGRMALPHLYLYNGTYTWDYDGFLPGDIHYQGKLYHGLMLDIDASRHDVLVRYSESVFSLAPVRGDVRYFTRGSRRWDNLHDWGHPEAPEGFMEVVVDGGRNTLYRYVRRLYRSDVNIPENALGPDAPPLKEGVIVYFEYSEQWWVPGHDGKLVRIRNKNQFLSMHADKRKAVNQHMKAVGMQLVPFRTWIVEAAKFVNETGGHE